MKKKIIMTLLLVLPIISNFTTTSGDETINTNNIDQINTRTIVAGGGDKFDYKIDTDKWMTITNNQTGIKFRRNALYMRLKGTDIPVYCVQPEIGNVSGNGVESSETWDKLNPTQQQNISRIIQIADSKIYQGLSNDYNLAGQMLVWEQLGYTVVAQSFDISQQINEIKAELSTYDIVPSFDNQTIALKYNPITKRSEASITDTNEVLSTKFPNLNNISIKGYEITRNENTLTISTNDYTNNPIAINNTTTSDKTRWQPVDNGQPGYLVDTFQDTVYGLNSYVDFSFNVQPSNGSVNFVKKDDHDQPLAGSVFDIYQDLNANKVIDQGDNVFSSVKSNKDGSVGSSLLPDGNYIIKEVQAPSGYINDGYEEAFIINGLGTSITLNNHQPVINKKVEGYVEITKVDALNVRLSNAEFSVYEDINGDKQIDDKDKLVTKLTTDANGYSKTDYLLGGDYIIKETDAPSGYVNNDELLYFSINEDNVKNANADKLIASFEVVNHKQEIKKQSVKTGIQAPTMMLAVTGLTGIVIFIFIKQRNNKVEGI